MAPNAFTRSILTRIATVAEVETQLQATPSLQLFGPYPAGTANMEEKRCRLLCPLPAKYAAIALQRPYYTPNEFWLNVIQQIIADGHTVACANLLIWARMAFHLRTLPAPGGDVTANVSNQATAPLADGELLDWVSGWIQADLPDHAPLASAHNVRLQLLAQQQMLANLVANQQLVAAAAAQPKQKPSRPSFPCC
jgi:hypothetical protein